MKNKKMGILIGILVVLLIAGTVVLIMDSEKKDITVEKPKEKNTVEYSSEKLTEIHDLLEIVGIYYDKELGYTSNVLNRTVNKLIVNDRKTKHEILRQNVIKSDKYLVDSVSFIGGSTHTYIINNIELEKIAKKYNITNIDSLFAEGDIQITNDVIQSSIDTDGNVVNIYEKKYKFVRTETSVEGGIFYTYKNKFNVEYEEDSISIDSSNCSSSNVDDSETCELFTYVFKKNKNKEFYLAEVKSAV